MIIAICYGTYRIAQNFDGKKSDKFDEWWVICQSFPFQSFPCNTFPMKATINLLKFCLPKFHVCPICQSFRQAFALYGIYLQCATIMWPKTSVKGNRCALCIMFKRYKVPYKQNIWQTLYLVNVGWKGTAFKIFSGSEITAKLPNDIVSKCINYHVTLIGALCNCSFM